MSSYKTNFGYRTDKRAGMSYSQHTIKKSRSDRFFYGLVYFVLGLLCITILYPLIFVLSSSFSSTKAVTEGRVYLWPVEFSLAGYNAVFAQKDIFIGFRNSFMYMFLGTVVNVSMTLVAAYPLSRDDTPMRGMFMKLFTFTMFFSGGMIPTYIVVKNTGLINTIFAMIIPGAISVWNLVITRTFMQTGVPHELLEASQIDGCSDIRYFFAILLPLSQSVIAVISLYYAVGHWNSYFDALMYLDNRALYPLQIFLREVLILNSIENDIIYDEELAEAKQGLADLLKYSLVIVSVAPMLILYPFVQKFFVKGVMIGSLKG